MQAVIMAGGKGTRLKSITKDIIPKPMAEVYGKPILEWQILQLRRQGITDIVLVVGFLGNVIRDYFKDGHKYGVNLRYIEESTPLGTAGALSLLPPLLDNNPFFLIFGDIIFDIDLKRMAQFHAEKKSFATLFAHPNNHPYDSDLLICDELDQVTNFDSKHNKRDYWYHNCVNAGIYLLDYNICTYVPANTKVDLEKDILSSLIMNGVPVFAYKSPEYVKDVGTVDRIHSVAMDIQNGIVANRNLRNRQKAIFLDRDGTINCKKNYIYEQNQFELLPNVAEAIQRINKSGYLAIVVTNQPVVARGMCSIDDIEDIHKKMETLLGQEGAYLDAIFFCPHHPDRGFPEENPAYKITCNCRKPKTGMFQLAAEKYNIDFTQSWMIGDGTIDIQAGHNAGTHTALVCTGDAGKDGRYNVSPEFVAKDLLIAVNKIIGGTV